MVLITYNHAPYIEQTLESILKQKRTFKMQLIVHDDASTDGTGDIIKRYADEYRDVITMIIQKENQYQKNIPVDIYAIPYIYGKYVAFCEGDDYWPDLEKLQKQVRYMEEHFDIAGTGGLTRYYNDADEECDIPLPERKFLNRIISKKEFASRKPFTIASNTLMVKADVVKNEKFICARKASPRVGDLLLFASTFEYGDIYMFQDCFQSHRVQTRSDASNYNSLYNAKEKFEDLVRAFEASVTYLRSSIYRRRFICYTSTMFWVLLRQNNVRAFIEVAKNVLPRYRKYIVLGILRTFVVVVPESVVRHVKDRIIS